MLPSPTINIRITAANQTGGPLSAAAQGLDRVKLGTEAVSRALAGQSGESAKADVAMLRLATTSAKLAQAQQEVISAGNKLASTTGNNTREAEKYEAAIRRLNTTQSQFIRDQQKMNDQRPKFGPPMPTDRGPTPSGGGGIPAEASRRGGGLLGGVLGGAARNLIGAAGQTLAYGAVGLAAYGAAQAGSAAFAYDATQASTRATTGISKASLAKITKHIQDYIATGKSQYDANTLLQGVYYILSNGITDPDQAWRIYEASLASATASGAQDTMASTQGLTTVLNSWGMGGNQAMAAQNQIQEAINQGNVDPTQVAGAFASFAKTAAGAKVSLSEAAGTFAFDTLTSKSAQLSGDNLNAFITAINSPNTAQKAMADKLHIKIGSGVLAKEGIAGFVADALAKTKGPDQAGFLHTLMGQENAAALMQGIATQPGKFAQFMKNAQGIDPNLTTKAASIVTDSDSGKLKGDMKRLGDDMMHIAEKVLPPFVTAMGGLVTAVDAMAKLLDGNTLSHFLNPTDPAFLDLGRAEKESAADALAKASPTDTKPGGSQDPARYRTTNGRFQKVTPHIGPRSVPGTPYWIDTVTGKHYRTLGEANNAANQEDVARLHPAGSPGSFEAGIGAGPTVPPLPERNTGQGPTRAGAPPPEVVPNLPDTRAMRARAETGNARDAALYASQAGARALLHKRVTNKRSGDMTSAMQVLQGLIAMGGAESEINAARKDYIAAVHDSPVDPKDWPYYDNLANKMVDAYHKGQAALKRTAAAQAAQTTYGGLLDQATLAGMQGNTAAAQRFTQQADSFELSHAALLNKTSVQAQIDVAGRKTNAAGLAAQATYKTLQERLTLAQVQNNPAAIALATKNLNAFESGNATLLGIDSTQVQIDIAQRAVAKTAQPVLADGPTLLRPNMAGMGALSAGPGGAAARFGRTGSDPMTHQIRILEAQLAAAKANEHRQEQMIKSLQDQLNVLRDSRGALNTIVTNTAPAHPQHTSHSTHHPYGRRRGH